MAPNMLLSDQAHVLGNDLCTGIDAGGISKKTSGINEMLVLVFKGQHCHDYCKASTALSCSSFHSTGVL